MTVRHFAAATLSLAMGAATASAVAARAADPVTLTGCLVKADRGDGYLVVNAPREPVLAAGERPATAPGTAGTTSMLTNVFYWLDKDDDLTPHVGHQVEVTGDVKGQLREGQIKIDRKDQWTEIEVKADGREMKAKVPNASVVGGPNSDRKVDVLVRRVDVDKVRMLDAACR